ncbi:unnamed protein product, partial [Ectocarpus fasciculatus]
MEERLNTPYKYLIEVGEGFWNIRGSFVALGVIELGTHMSIVRLSSGKFLVIDTLPLNPQLKTELDHLTDNAYPSLRYYGTPRHLNVLPTLTWTGSIFDREVQELWEPDVSMRIPDGAEFVNPPSDNHFSCVFVFHRASQTIHIDDTVCYFEDPGCLLSLIGAKKGSMKFHTSMTKAGLLPTPEAPYDFKNWVQAIINEWDFDTVCTAHNGNKIGGAKAQLQDTLDRAEP